MEIKTSMVTCPNGHHYDSSKHASCPYCAGVPVTGAPGGGFAPTQAPAGQSGGFAPTEAPMGGGGYAYRGDANASFGATEAPNRVRQDPEPFGNPTIIGGDRADGAVSEPVVGWLVCTSGPARGSDYRLHAGYNYIGRETGDVRIRGDQQISRQNHAMVAFDSSELMFYVGPAAGRNILKVNGHAVLTAVELSAYDEISIGTTKLMFVPLCGESFNWNEQDNA